ncbi:MAG: menaquinone biosynthesis protein [Gemmatimonadota bacterium]|nr:menaquinone biosynthesis protein [Gemmatimonadota bacterium]MDP6529694.1 menaquinone biosynthesis protein [Gemmatimonadota bacterium]MDP6802481.1 menaquinone biosynthesis protein [Gemmatimonadota bacterium]MDP7030962.1 menaquinone biosynthesis protein [Gemmatimonadota bacterium]
MSSKPRTRLTLALIPYLNCEPFYGGIGELGYDIVREPPRELGRMAREEDLTCGPMAVADLFRLESRYEPLGDFGISCEGPAHSVLLFSRTEIGDLSGARIGLTAESSTSVQLLRLVLECKYELTDIDFIRGKSEDDVARLLIGDEALVAACDGGSEFPFVYDLGEEWHGWQALPFVFARWAVSRKVAEEDRRRVTDSLEESLAGWKLRIPEIAARCGAAFGLNAAGVLRYLETFRYRLGPVESLGENQFREMLSGLPVGGPG